MNFKKTICILLFLSLSALLVSMSSNPKYLTFSDDYHIAKKGETLTSIGQEYSISVEKLKLFNNLKSDRIFVGQKIYLYPREQKKSEYVTVRSIPKKGYHVVKSKESIYRLAKMYDVSIFDLLDYNDLHSLELAPGMKLWLNGRGKPSQTETKITQTTKTKKEKPKKSIITKLKKKNLFLPVKGNVTSEFGMRNGRPHKGIDIATSTGEPIHAALDGKVVFAGTQRGYGNVIILEHDDYVMTVYAHNEANLVRLGDLVKKGQPIASVGQTGTATGPHLHFEYRLKGKAINPRDVLPKI
jgi:lipoprotein NlpD